MNWNRIWTGALLAGLAIFGLDFVINHLVLGRFWHTLHLQGQLMDLRPYTIPLLFLQDLGIGFVLTWLYALARPRLGPGPKTALLMGTLAWFLMTVPACINQWLWVPNIPAHVTATLFLGGLIQCWAGIYLAGWQYIEKAP